MLNFRALFEFLFKSFRVARDTELVERLANDGERFVLIIKRSWIFAIFTLLFFIPVGALLAANIFLALKHFGHTPMGYVVVSVLAINIVYLFLLTVRYAVHFKATYRNANTIVDVYTLKGNLEEGDNYFTSFFNQTNFNIILFAIMAGFYVVHIAFISQFATGFWGVIDILCLFAQYLLARKITTNMINLEMDFAIAIPGKLYFVNQKGFYVDIQTLEADKIKTIRSQYPNFLASFFHYGNIDILTEGDIGLMGVMTLAYVENPENTVENVSKILLGNIEMHERIHNVYLQKIIERYKIDRNPETFHASMQRYLKEYEAQIKDDYINAQDEGTREEIRAIYAEYLGQK